MTKVKGERPKALLDVPFHYCPGCTHGIVHRLVAEDQNKFSTICFHQIASLNAHGLWHCNNNTNS